MADNKPQTTSGSTVLAEPGTNPPIRPASRPPGSPPAAGTAPPAAPRDPMVGTILSERYRILDRLGEGGMGTVYLAEHTTINKKLAIKILSPDYTHKQDLVDRFLQEARAASMINQENVVEITDFGRAPNGSVYFVMEYLQGEDLSNTVKREGALPWARVRPIMVQICRALQAAHDSGIIHRDMKPENCYRIRRSGTQDFIKVLDFGIAKVTSEEEGGKGLTRTGMIFGTPEYMSPEQAQGTRPDNRVDVYAVGVIMYELLTGRVPFTADTFMGILTKHMFEAPIALRTLAPQAAIPVDAEAIVLKAMQKDRELRFQNMTEMAAAIEAVGTGAVPVRVIEEQVSRPLGGAMDFSGTRGPITRPPEGEAPASSARRNLFIGLVALGVLAGGGAFVAMKGGETPAPAPAQVAAATTPSVAAPPTPTVANPTVVPTPPPVAEQVVLRIATPGVDAEVRDGRDNGVLGKTNAPDGVKIAKTDEEVSIVLRAPGYEDLMFSVVPDGDKKFEQTLKKLTPADPRKKPSGHKKVAPRDQPKPKGPDIGAAIAKPTPTLTPPASKKDPKKKPAKPSTTDLKDPFGGG